MSSRLSPTSSSTAQASGTPAGFRWYRRAGAHAARERRGARPGYGPISASNGPARGLGRQRGRRRPFSRMPYFAVYAASKAFVLSARPCGQSTERPKVVTVCTGPVETPFHGRPGETSEQSGVKGFLRRRYMTPARVPRAASMPSSGPASGRGPHARSRPPLPPRRDGPRPRTGAGAFENIRANAPLVLRPAASGLTESPHRQGPL